MGWSYMDKDKIEKLQPKWRKHRHYTYGKEAVVVHEKNATGQRVVARYIDDDGMQKEIAVPHQPSERWIDPAGNIVPLVTSPNRLGLNSAGYAAAKRQEKRAKGWISYDTPEHGVALEEWHDRCLKEIEVRQAKHRKHEEAYGKAYKSREELLVNKTGEALAEAIRSIGPAVAEGIEQAEQRRSRRKDKGE